MPIFFQHLINENTRLGVWKIEEPASFFEHNVPLSRQVTHPHKRLQHLAGRFLLQFLFPDFPYELIQIADTRKPFLPGEEFHFSISHCGDYAAAIVSRDSRVGIDIEMPVPKINWIKNKFLSHPEQAAFGVDSKSQVEEGDRLGTLTLLWSAKEAVYKWHGTGNLDFIRHIQLTGKTADGIDAFFLKDGNQSILIRYLQLDHLILTWIT